MEVAAADKGKSAVMIVNLTNREQELKISGISEKGICRIVDDKRTYEEVQLPKVLSRNAILIVTSEKVD
jgi:hypothetical protein